MTPSLLVFNIGFTIGVDGPGQRMVIYLKGCNMVCPWCAAPESIQPRPEVLFYPSRLDDPQRARSACPHNAVSVCEDKAVRNVNVCASCSTLDCANSGNPAFDQLGEEMTVQSIVDRALRYRSFFAETGGVTIGGGEPTCQFDAVKSLLVSLHGIGIHTALETNGTNPRLPELFPYLDLAFIDLKHPDSARCAEIAGQGNKAVLQNIKNRHSSSGKMVVRIPLVPGYNADDKTLHGFGRKLAAIGPLTVEVLPFHRRGEVKWQALGLEMPAQDAVEPALEFVQRARDILEDYGQQLIN